MTDPTVPSVDPTAFEFETIAEVPFDSTNPFTRRSRGFAVHGNTPFDMPLVTQVAENLYHGGVVWGVTLPKNILHVVSLYPWGGYNIEHELLSYTEVKMFDSEEQSFEQIEHLAAWVNLCRESGPVLVHCQAGLNRSSLVVAKALVLSGEVADGQEAINKLRATRSPACLCNPAFESWVRELTS
jgi:hypothetical protein